jgi:predicted nucleotidyltransferase
VPAEAIVADGSNLDRKNPAAKVDFEHMPPEQLVEDILAKERRVVERIPAGPPGLRPSREEIAAVAAFIGERFRPERVVLFGSRAYGVPCVASDVDLMVVMEAPRGPLQEALRIRLALELDPPFPLDVLVRTPEQVREGLAAGELFIGEVLGKGVVLFEAGDAGVG